MVGFHGHVTLRIVFDVFRTASIAQLTATLPALRRIPGNVGRANAASIEFQTQNGTPRHGTPSARLGCHLPHSGDLASHEIQILTASHRRSPTRRTPFCEEMEERP